MIAVFALVGVVVAIVVSQSGDDDEPSGLPPTLELVAAVDQDGLSVGDPKAPFTLTEYGDLQCPFCADAAEEVIPPLLEEQVASGELRIDFRPLAFLGPDSQLAAQVAIAAGEQDLGFAFVEAFYADQGTENSGYVTEEFLRDVGAEVDGLDMDKALADASDPATSEALERSVADAEKAGVNSTPTFLIGPTGEAGTLVNASTSDPPAFLDEVEAALAR